MLGGPGTAGTGGTGSLARPGSRKPGGAWRSVAELAAGANGSAAAPGTARPGAPRQPIMRGGGKAGWAGGAAGHAHFLSGSQWALTLCAEAPPLARLPPNERRGRAERRSPQGAERGV